MHYVVLSFVYNHPQLNKLKILILIQINTKKKKVEEKADRFHRIFFIALKKIIACHIPILQKKIEETIPVPFLHDITDNHLPDEIVNTQTACGAHFWRPNVEIAISYCPPISRGNWKVLGNKCPSDRVIVFCRVLASNGISSRFQLIPMHRDSRSHSR